MKQATSLSRIAKLGSAKEGVASWRAQRLRGIALVPLTIWFVYSMVGLAGADHEAFKAWISQHGNALMMMMLIITMFPHSWQGMRTILEDYVHSEPARTIAAVTLKFIMYACGLSCCMAVIKFYVGV